MTNKTITVKVPDTIPDPELSILARYKDTFDEWESVEYEEAGTCKWDVEKVYATIYCQPCPTIIKTIWQRGYEYCPFCGRKIERT